MYERINIHYPLWVSIIANGIFFGLLHAFNPGVSVMAIVGIAICGVSYSIVRWYTGSIWIPMGIHTMWNFTQNFIFGLPNSGIVSEYSIFRLEAASARNGLFYNVNFGVEGSIGSSLVLIVVIIVMIIINRNKPEKRDYWADAERKAAEELAMKDSAQQPYL